MGKRVVYRTVAVSTILGAVIGFACNQYGEEEQVDAPSRDGGDDDGGASDAIAADAGADGSLVDGAVSDAQGDADDGAAAAACLAACTGANKSCIGGACVVTCGANGNCSNMVVCPKGIPCVVVCSDTNTCATTSCGEASSCTYECNAKDACRLGTTCGSAGDCTYHCNGENACREIECGMASTCTVDCDDPLKERCREAIDCPKRTNSTCNVACGTQGCYLTTVECCTGATCNVTGSGATKNNVTCP